MSTLIFLALRRCMHQTLPICILTLLTCLSTDLSAQTDWRVFLSDKGGTDFEPGSELYEAARAQLTERCLERRARNMAPGTLISLEDAPLYAPYLQAITEAGAQIQLELRWRNYAVVTCSESIAAAIKELEFVDVVQRCANVTTTLSCEAPASRLVIGQSACGGLEYGESWNQVASVHAPELHTLGILGQGVRIGAIDSGFRWRDTPALQHLNVIAERDFIYLDDLTADEPDELPGQEGHGTLVLSALAGLDDSELIGIAPLAEFLLAKTEDLRYERHREEDNFAAAVEWIEANGAEVLTASVGYLGFDQDQEAYADDIRDGRTSICTQAINAATERGLLCVISAGNTGPSPQSLLLPADAPDAIAVAAVSPEGRIEAYSARGPAGSNLKPNVAAQGSAVKAAVPGPEGNYVSINGTSMAAPLICGGLALLLELHPERSAREIREILYANASQSAQPDSAIGYGIANFTRSAQELGPLVSVQPSWYPLGSVQRVVLSSQIPDAQATLFVRSTTRELLEFSMSFAAPMHYYADIPRSLFNDAQAETLEAYIEFNAQGQNLRRPAPSPQEPSPVFNICADGAQIACGLAVDLLPRSFPAAADEGIFPSVAGRTDARTIIVNSSKQQRWQAKVYDLEGRLQSAEASGFLAPGFNALPVDTRRLASGMYLLRLQLHDQAKYFSFFVVE